MSRNLSEEPTLPIANIQGDILIGLLKRHEHLMFFEVTDAPKFKTFLKTLHVTSAEECLGQRAALTALEARGDDTVIPTPGLNIAFTFAGLTTLGVAGIPNDASTAAFRDGMASRQATLLDPPASSWKVLKPNPQLHGVFIVTGATHAETVDIMTLRLAPAAGNGWKLLHEEVGEVRPAPVVGHEHFGYADGVSQPGVRGIVSPGTPLTPQSGPDPDQGAPGQDLLWPGEFVFGYPGQNADASSFTTKGDVAAPPIPLMQDGAYMVFRRLAQLVPEFNASVKQAAAGITGASDKASADLLGAQLVGRWKSGAPLILAETADNPAFADGELFTNAFEFGDDREGLKCPWAAHIRKAYPRDDVPGNMNPDDADVGKAEAFTQTHRMLRRGISFGPELTEQEALNQQSAGGPLARGLLFKCYITSIDDQFEFVQQAWCNNASFSQPNSGIDAIIGQSATSPRPFLGAAPISENPTNKPQFQLKSFVNMEGGGYFFAPSISALRSL